MKLSENAVAGGFIFRLHELYAGFLSLVIFTGDPNHACGIVEYIISISPEEVGCFDVTSSEGAKRIFAAPSIPDFVMQFSPLTEFLYGIPKSVIELTRM